MLPVLEPRRAARLLVAAARKAGTLRGLEALRELGDVEGHAFHGNQWTDDASPTFHDAPYHAPTFGKLGRGRELAAEVLRKASSWFGNGKGQARVPTRGAHSASRIVKGAENLLEERGFRRVRGEPRWLSPDGLVARVHADDAHTVFITVQKNPHAWRTAGDIEGHAFHGNQWTSSAANEVSFVEAGQRNNVVLSRTAKGVYDASAQVGKPGLATTRDVAEHAAANNADALRFAWAERDAPASDVQRVVEGLAQRELQGMFNDANIWRTTEGTKEFPYAPPSTIPERMQAFYTEFAQRADADPVATAAWAEKTLLVDVHPFVDAVGRTSRAVSAWTLARAGLPLPHYGDRKAYLKAVNRPLDEFVAYYRTLMPEHKAAGDIEGHAFHGNQWTTAASSAIAETHGTTLHPEAANFLLRDGTLVRGNSFHHQNSAQQAGTTLEALEQEGVVRMVGGGAEVPVVPSIEQAKLLADHWNTDRDRKDHFLDVSTGGVTLGSVKFEGRVTAEAIRNFAKRALANPRDQPPLYEVRRLSAAGDVSGHDFHGNQWAQIRDSLLGTPEEQKAEADNQQVLADAQKDPLAHPDIVIGGSNDPATTRYVAAYGERFKAAPLPDDLRKMQDKQCYRNASTMIMDRPDLDYAEGFARNGATGDLVFLHAWGVTHEGTVVDPTWRNPEKGEYFGVRYDRAAYLAHLVTAKIYGVVGSTRDNEKKAVATGGRGLRKATKALGEAIGHEFHGNQWTSGSGASGVAVRSEKSLRALRAFVPAHASSQRHAEANELEVRRLVGGTRTDDNLPVDVVTTVDGKTKGLEVKTVLTNTNDKITMRAAALEKKHAWARSHHASLHTIVVDDRGKLGHKEYSGHRLYHAKGVGSFRLAGMTRVRDTAHLKELLAR